MNSFNPSKRHEFREHLAALLWAVGSPSDGDQVPGNWWLSNRTARDWLLLDDFARDGYEPAVVAGPARWAENPTDLANGFSAAVMSLHSDGRVRQRAVRFLAVSEGVLGVSALAVRCLDHVAQVRAEANRSFLTKTDSTSVNVILGILLAGAKRFHSAEALSAYRSRLLSLPDLDALLKALRASDNHLVRRWAFNRSFEHELLTADDLLWAARHEQDQLIRVQCADRACAVASEETVRELLAEKHTESRLAAVLHLGDAGLSDADLTGLLIDPSARIREIAQLKLKRRGFDPAVVYRQCLEEGRRIAFALVGMAATGNPEDLTVVQPWLADGGPAIRKAAVQAVSALAGDRRLPLLAPMLLDASPGPVAAAGRALVALGAGADAAAAAWRSDQVWSRRAAWRLCRAAGGWDRVVWDLEAAADPDPELSKLGQFGVRNWLLYSAATTWGVVAPARAERIKSLLKVAPLPEHVLREVAFAANVSRAN